MHFHHIALNVPLGLMTYSHSEPLPLGTRVGVPFRGKTLVGIVWQNEVEPDIALHKIKAIEQVFDQEPTLPRQWRELCDFASRYYHHPIGQTAFAALPQILRVCKAANLPSEPLYHRLNAVGKIQTLSKRASKQLLLWQTLQNGWCSEQEMKKLHPQAKKIVQQWQKNGWIETQNFNKLPEIGHSQHILTPQQKSAAQSIRDADQTFTPFLLYGITGSGKTEVYFDALAHVLASGRQVLFLLPEIGLTPQLLRRVQQRFADVPTAVLHSQTAAGARGRDYIRAMKGEAKLIIGTRLAVFVPLPDLGLIVVDEEHDASFKQDNDLRYHARDLAVWRAKQSNCPIILGSATPSLESWHKAQTGHYCLLTLNERAHQGATLPDITLLDVRRIHLDNGFAPELLKLLQQNFQQGGMSLVYLNRRGFAPALFCSDCGHLFSCPDCSAKMVLHQRAKQLRCHHCNHKTPIAQACPECGNQDLTAIGQGTQRIEETLRQTIPQAKILRADRDSIHHKDDWNDFYQMIETGVDILVGTQMLAKGHDFSRLNLVIVINADGSLYSTDFRAPERLFAELMQVAGRAGRADLAGRVIIQTQLPEHPVFQYLCQHNYSGFAENELKERQSFALPPFAYQAAIRADAEQSLIAFQLLEQIKHKLKDLLPKEVSQMGPAPMPMLRLAGRERAQLFLESENRLHLHRAIHLWQANLAAQSPHHIRWHIDVDAQEM